MTISQQEAPIQEKPQAKRSKTWVYILVAFILFAIMVIAFLSWLGPQIEEIFNRVPCACLMGEDIDWKMIFLS